MDVTTAIVSACWTMINDPVTIPILRHTSLNSKPRKILGGVSSVIRI